MIIETMKFDDMVSRLKSILDKEVVLIGDDSDEVIYRTTINYGAITDNSAELSSSSSNSKMSLTIENFI